MNLPIFTVEIRREPDVVQARQRARQISDLMRFDKQDQVRLATAVSELARNAFQYAGGGKVEFFIEDGVPQVLRARISDRGHGISALDRILNGQYVSQTGMGLGIIGAKRLMDEFQVESSSAGTTFVLGKHLSETQSAVTKTGLGRIIESISSLGSQDALTEVQRQNQDLLAAMSELKRQQLELSGLNRELKDTNRGVVALYAELDQRAQYLRQISESKTRFLSNITHEFRTPLNSIQSLSRMLADKLDGELTPEQEIQVGYIRRAASELSTMVDDLLDLAKVESGKVTARADRFDLAGVFKSLRGTLGPLLAQNSLVALIFEVPEGVPELVSDESKITQILRNFISNAFKFTERGEVRVSARMDGSQHVLISVTDTGIGIAPENRERIFEEFEQVEGPHQLKCKGTGLGLPLAKAWAELLGGRVSLETELGVGSTFSVRLRIDSAKEAAPGSPKAPGENAVLIVDDDVTSRYLLRSIVGERFADTLEAAGGGEALRLAANFKPSLIILDLGLPDQDGSMVLQQLKSNPATMQIPVIINTSRNLAALEREHLEKQASAVLSKNAESADALRTAVDRALTPANPTK